MPQISLTLHDGNTIPQMGMGMGGIPADKTPGHVRTAVEQGFRHFDTARAYRNESETGEGVRTCGLPRDQLFVTSKLWCEFHGYEATLAFFDETMKGMGLDYLDLFLIHWPNPHLNLYVETWKALIHLRDEGRIRSIGVSNFAPEHLDRLKAETGEMPVVNQVELNPRFQQADLRKAHAERGVVTEAWGPLTHGMNIADPVFDAISAKHGRSPIQVALRWHIQNGIVAIPRAEKVEWMRDNLAAFDFALDADDIAAIATLDDPNGRTGPVPDTTLDERMAILRATLGKKTPVEID